MKTDQISSIFGGWS